MLEKRWQSHLHRPDSNQSTIIEIRLSDFHKFTVTALKSYFKKLEPKKLLHRHFNKFYKQQFQTELVKELSENNVDAS